MSTKQHLEAAGPSPHSVDEVDEWLARYMASVEASRKEARRVERLNEAAPSLLAALEAEEEWRRREADGALDPDWSYEQMVGNKRRAAIAKVTGSAS